MRYHVRWEIDFDEGDEVTSPVEAAKLARTIQRDPMSEAVYFTVQTFDDDARKLVDERDIDLFKEG